MGSIDIVVNLFTAQEIANNQVGIDQDFMAQIRMPPDMRKGVSIPQYIKKMDKCRHRPLAACRGAGRRPAGEGVVRDSLRTRP